jgi:CHAT domain-containing protein
VNAFKPSAVSLAALSIALAAPAAAQEGSIGTRDSFRIGSGGAVVCTAQNQLTDPGLADMFDRAYAITCRDAAVPVGKLYALKLRKADPAARLAEARTATAQCQPAAADTIEGLGAVSKSECKYNAADIGYRVYAAQEGDTLYVAEGLAGYDSALRLGLRTLVADAPVEGEIAVAATDAGDPAAFARVQAGTLNPESALAEAYARNNSGAYAEAAEFFQTLIDREGASQSPRSAEYLMNQALQESNLGNFAEAERIFEGARAAMPPGDPVLTRLLRNFTAMHLLNQRRFEPALEELRRAVTPTQQAEAAAAAEGAVITEELSERLNRSSPLAASLTGIGDALTPEERAQILDAQALQLQGTALRIQGDYPAALAALAEAERRLLAVRQGRVASAAGLNAEVHAERALIAERSNDFATAEAEFREALRILQTEYPESAASLTAKARLAAYLGRRGQIDAARETYREVVESSDRVAGAAASLRNLLRPYFALLAERAASDPSAVEDMFVASQILVRPGVAQTQAILARELSGGNDEASGLFRQSVTLTRDIERLRTEVARLAAQQERSAQDNAMMEAGRERIAALEVEQTAIQAKLADFPRYRVVTTGAMPLKELQETLKEGEGYYKLTTIGNDAYAVMVTPSAARAFKVGRSVRSLEDAVGELRDTITVNEAGQQVTYPFNIALARRLYVDLFEPVGGDVAAVSHLIFEPDGPFLQLPVNLLVTEQAGVDRYAERIRQPGSDEYDFRGVAWLGRDKDVSTAVSARSFRDVRTIAPSAADNNYIGFGQNAPISSADLLASSTRSLLGGDTCAWPAAAWNQPISAEELVMARGIVGDGGSQVVTGQAFTDTAIRRNDNLDEYRILHFATHGLVTAPRPECPARPALLTSFGEEEQSDGLLTFREIFDLRLDADLVILSACDTAGRATVEATREAGLTTGGGQALDGLVRAFVGAGGRSVIASHWPVPDDFNATNRLIGGMFRAPAGTAIATALRTTQRQLMDDAETSHPYYWSGFAIIGDGARPMLREGTQTAAVGN